MTRKEFIEESRYEAISFFKHQLDFMHPVLQKLDRESFIQAFLEFNERLEGLNQNNRQEWEKIADHYILLGHHSMRNPNENWKLDLLNDLLKGNVEIGEYKPTFKT